MGIYSICNIVLLLCISCGDLQEIFDLHADELMDTLMKDVYKGKFEKSVPDNINKKDISNFQSTTQKQVTSSKIFSATKHPITNNYAGNMTLEEFSARKRKIDVKVLLESNIGSIPNFDDNDEIAVQTRRFDQVNESANQDIFLREIYFDKDDKALIFKEKKRIISLMAQFVYETRYQLPYAQLIRKKYIKHVRYRIGYCFALLKTLKQQQMVIYNTMKNYLDKWLTLYWHMKLYEKVVKLNVDIRDLIKYIVHLDKVRQSQVDSKNSKRRPRD